MTSDPLSKRSPLRDEVHIASSHAGMDEDPPLLRRRLAPRHESTVAAIVNLLTPAYPPLEPETRGSILADVTRFVSAQIQSLPSFLRAPYKLALTAFDWLPVIRYRHRFVTLDAQSRAGYLEFWSDGPVSVFRNFVKLIRSCALLAYYDHPMLRDALTSQSVCGATTSERSPAAAR